MRDADDLQRAIRKAQPGTTIRLGGGLYGALDLGKRNPVAGPVSIVSASANDPAVFSSIKARGIDGLTLSQIQVVAPAHDPKRPYLVDIEGGSDIVLDRIGVRGAGGEDRLREYALWLRNVARVEVRDSAFSGTRYGIGILDGKQVAITNNELSGIQTDGIRGGGIDDLTISGNVLTGFSPKPGEHPDGIQLWSTNQTVPAKRITIRDNLIARGEGGMTQGIFVRDTNNALPFEDLVIEGNLIVGSMYNGIAVLGLNRGRIANNRVVPYGDQKAWIRVDKAADVEIRGNAAPQFLADGKAATLRDNVAGTRPVASAGGEVRAWLAKRAWLKERAGPHLARLVAE
ncbi:right-handed parallel beta-helix repeat-containing protein [Novosphingobium huizhouense]|uniref:right-handed parallel beta-helix repeat-containing protein n=1 Tax=Novosphingobium huizhouense TaxID=2866625 RepID=UPI001CD83658|nr:right-handed parallel beta-helix repeat-containing protein [Novosphingobium huizhouense]